jgi:hypothetical protein
MMSRNRFGKVSLIVTACGIAGLAFLLLTSGLTGVRAQTALQDLQENGTSLEYRGITLTAGIPLWDPDPGAATGRSVYFNNSSVEGSLTATFAISGTPPLTLTASPAFGSPAGVMTASVSPWTPTVVYTVGSGAMSQPGVLYTVTNTDSLVTLVITYERDVTAPEIAVPSIVTASDQYFYAPAVALYYTNTMPVEQNFAVSGRSDDAGSGVERVAFTPALGDSPPDVVSGFPSWQSAGYGVDTGETQSGLITATVYDRVGNAALQTYTYALDSAGPYTGSIRIENDQPYVAQPEVDLALSAADAGCGVDEMCISDASICPAENWEAFASTAPWTLPGDDGEKTVWVAYRDYLGNESIPFSDTVVLDSKPFTVVVNAPVYTSSLEFPVSWATTGSSLDIVSYTMAYKEDDGEWNDWSLPDPLITHTIFNNATLGHTYTFSVTAHNQANKSAQGSAETVVDNFYVYLPLVLRNYDPFTNGDFDSGFSGWTTGKGPFNGRGSGLPQGIVEYDGDIRALLGSTTYQDGSIPTGYGFIAQQFLVEKPYLDLEYRVFTYDVVKSSGRYYDTFELSINVPPSGVTNDQRDSLGCNDTNGILNPDGTLIVSSDGLALCGGRYGTSDDPGTPYNTHWKSVTLDLSAFQGEIVTLYFAVWSREYQSPFYDDQAWYNTWAYVDRLVPHD